MKLIKHITLICASFVLTTITSGQDTLKFERATTIQTLENGNIAIATNPIVLQQTLDSIYALHARMADSLQAGTVTGTSKFLRLLETLETGGDVLVGSDLEVIGSATITSDASIGGNTSMTGALDVDGSSELDGLNVDGATTMDALSADGVVNFQAGLNVSGATSTGIINGRDMGADGAKLDGIQAGAQANVQPDWNATAGDGQILNKPDLAALDDAVLTQGYQTIAGLKTFESPLRVTTTAPGPADQLQSYPVQVSGAQHGVGIQVNGNTEYNHFMSFFANDGSVLGRIEGRNTYFGSPVSAATTEGQHFTSITTSTQNFIENGLDTDMGSGADNVPKCNWTITLNDVQTEADYTYEFNGQTYYVRPEIWVWVQEGSTWFYTDSTPSIYDEATDLSPSDWSGSGSVPGDDYVLKRFALFGYGAGEVPAGATSHTWTFPVPKDYNVEIQYVMTGEMGEASRGLTMHSGGGVHYYGGWPIPEIPACCNNGCFSDAALPNCTGWSGTEAAPQETDFFKYWLDADGYPQWDFIHERHTLGVTVTEADGNTQASAQQSSAPTVNWPKVTSNIYHYVKNNGNDVAPIWAGFSTGFVGETQMRHNNGDNYDCTDEATDDDAAADEGNANYVVSNVNSGQDGFNLYGDEYEMLWLIIDLIDQVIDAILCWIGFLDWEDPVAEITDLVMVIIQFGADLAYDLNNNIGVAYTTGSGDYAEWLERADAFETIMAGDVVGVKGGKISKYFENPDYYMAVSSMPAMVGNMPEERDKWKYEQIAFIGQVPVRVMGECEIGDYIIPSGSHGLAVAKSESEMTIPDYKNVIGIAWEQSTVQTKSYEPQLINTVIGVNQKGLNEHVEKLNREMIELRNAVSKIEDAVADLSNGGRFFNRKKRHRSDFEFEENIRHQLTKPSPLKQTDLDGTELDICEDLQSCFLNGQIHYDGKVFNDQVQFADHLISDMEENMGIAIEDFPMVEAILKHPESHDKILDDAYDLLEEVMDLLPEHLRKPLREESMIEDGR